jgi:hypothetical protein
MAKEQSAQNHAAYDTLSHFVLMPIFFANFIFQIVLAVKAWPLAGVVHLWNVLIALALMLLTFKTRIYALADQDRIIRLEERLRIAALAPSADVSKLTTPQLIASTLAENLDPKAIKQSIATWRPDYQRI